jgi:hypothetical protein
MVHENVVQLLRVHLLQLVAGDEAGLGRPQQRRSLHGILVQGQDADRLGDGLGSRGVVSRRHDHLDSGSLNTMFGICIKFLYKCFNTKLPWPLFPTAISSLKPFLNFPRF